MENTQIQVWTEAHFNQLFQEAPRIKTPATYTTVQLILPTQKLEVKIPSGADQQTYKYLLSKAIYYHFLDKKDLNPLLKVAIISMFECADGFAKWYRLWMRGDPINRNTYVLVEYYSQNKGISGFRPVARLGNQNGLRFLARSCKNGEYYNVSIIQNKNISRQQLSLLHQNYKQQHPFIAHLCEFTKNSQYSYFVFKHHPFSLIQILTQTYQPLRKQQKLTLFIQLFLAMLFLQNQKLLNWSIALSNLFINCQGHLVIGEEVLGHYKISKQDQCNSSKIKILFQVYSLCILDQVQKEQGLFFHYLKQLQNRQKSTIKQIANHGWIRKQNIQKVLSKEHQILNPFQLLLHPNQSITQISSDQINKYFEQPNKKGPMIFQSYKISPRTTNQQIICRYQFSSQIFPPFCLQQLSSETQDSHNSNNNSHCYNSNKYKRMLRKSSSTSLLSIERKEKSKNKNGVEELDAYGKSPYHSVLKKQNIFSRKKKNC